MGLNFIADTRELTDAIAASARAAHSSKSGSGAFTNLRIEASEDQVCLTASQGVPLTVHHSFEAEVIEAGSILFPSFAAKAVTPISKAGGECFVSQEDGELTFQVGKRSASSPVFVGEYPETPFATGDMIVLSEEVIDAFAIALARSDAHNIEKAISGVYVVVTDKVVSCVSGASSASLSAWGEVVEGGIAIGRECVAEFLSAWKKTGKPEVAMTLGEKFAQFNVGETASIIGRVFAGSQTIWPAAGVLHQIKQERATTISVDSGEINSLLDHCQSLHERVTKGSAALYPLSIGVSSGGMKFSMHNPTFGSLEDELEPSEFDGPPVEIRCSPELLLRIVSSCEGETIQFMFGGPSTAFSTKGSDSDHISYLAPVSVDQTKEVPNEDS